MLGLAVASSSLPFLILRQHLPPRITLNFWSSCVHLPSADMTGIIGHCAQFIQCLKIEPKALYIWGEHCNNWALYNLSVASLPCCFEGSQSCVCHQRERSSYSNFSIPIYSEDEHLLVVIYSGPPKLQKGPKMISLAAKSSSFAVCAGLLGGPSLRSGNFSPKALWAVALVGG